MNEQQAKEAIKNAGGKWSVFMKWMRGQTVGVNEDNSIDYYDYDVNRFIRYKCNPKNEPIEDFD